MNPYDWVSAAVALALLITVIVVDRARTRGLARTRAEAAETARITAQAAADLATTRHEQTLARLSEITGQQATLADKMDAIETAVTASRATPRRRSSAPQLPDTV